MLIAGIIGLILGVALTVYSVTQTPPNLRGYYSKYYYALLAVIILVSVVAVILSLG